MFGLISGLYNSYTSETQLSILIVGCDGAGKTSFLERCKVTNLQLQKGKARKTEPSQQENKESSSKSNGINEGRHTICPSPASYRHSFVLDSDNEDVNEVQKLFANGDLEDANTGPNPAEDKSDDSFIEFDLRQGTKMLPLHMIKPTIGMNLATLKAFGCKCSFWDLGGKKQMQPLWERYYADADAVVFVVDITSDTDKINETREAFHSIKKDDKLAGVPILIFANKVDALSHDDENAMNDFITKLNIFPFERRHINQTDIDNLEGKKYPGIIGFDGVRLIRLCRGSAKTGAGVKDALEWLISTAKDQSLHNAGKEKE